MPSPSVSRARSGAATVAVMAIVASLLIGFAAPASAAPGEAEGGIASRAVPGGATAEVERLSGASRFDTSASISRERFSPGVEVAYVANGMQFPDALSAAPLAAIDGAPLLLSNTAALPQPVRVELERLRPQSIVVLGGRGAVSDAVAADLAALTEGDVTRLSGASRFETSAAISRRGFADGADTVFIANGMAFADALSGAPAAGMLGGPVLLVSPTELPAAVETELERLGPDRIVVLGGTGAVSQRVATRLASIAPDAEIDRWNGASRYETSAKISSESLDPGVPVAYVASGASFPDALSGAPVAGMESGPVLLVPGKEIPDAVRAELARLDPGAIVVLGGSGAVNASVAAELATFADPSIVRVRTADGASVPLAGAADGSALVNVRVPAGRSPLELSAGGAPVLSVDRGVAASTSVLVPVVDGRVALTGSASALVTIETLVSFAHGSAMPGATAALPKPVLRADTTAGLSGDALGQTPLHVGLTGLGGVPATGVRAVHVTATVDVDAATTLALGDQSMPIPAGSTSITTIVMPGAGGAVPASIADGTGSLRLDVRGWVAEADGTTNIVNVEGGYVPARATDPGVTAVTDEAPAAIDVAAVSDREFSLLLVTAMSDESARLTASADGEVLIDPERGAAPQLVVADAEEFALSAGAADVTWTHVGDVLGEALVGGAAPTVAITSPSAGATIDLAESGMVAIEGTVETSGASIRSLDVDARGSRVGWAVPVYSGAGLAWRFDTSSPVDGDVTFTVEARDRANGVGSDTRTVEFVLPGETDVVMAPDAAVVPSAGENAVVAAVTDDAVVLTESPEFVPGDVIVSGVSDEAPEGFLRRVTAIDETDGEWRVHTVHAAITDVVYQADEEDVIDLMGVGEPTLDTDVAPGAGDTPVEIIDEGEPAVVFVDEEDVDLEPYDQVDAGPVAAAGAGLRTSALDFGIDEEITRTLKIGVDLGWKTGDEKPKDTSKATKAKKDVVKTEIKATGGLSLSGAMEFGTSLHIVLKISATWDWGGPKVTVNEFSTVMGVKVKQSATVEAFLQVQMSHSHEHSVAKVKPAPVTFPVGPVPVVITTDFTVSSLASFTARVAVKTELSGQSEQKYGFTYSTDDGLEPVNTSTRTFKTPVLGRYGDAEVSGALEVSLGPKVSMSMNIYDAAGPEFFASAKVGGKATFTQDASGTDVDVSVFIDAGVGGKVKLLVPIIDHVLLEHELFSRSERFNLAHWEWDLTNVPVIGGGDGGDDDTPPDTVIDIPDPELRDCINEILERPSGEPISKGDLDQLTSVWCTGAYDISSLSGLEHASNLELVDMRGMAGLESIAPLAGLDLRQLLLGESGVSDLSPIALLSLSKLDIGGTAVTDLSALTSHREMRELRIYGLPVGDLGPIRDMRKLRSLNISSTEISDLAGIESLTGLEELSMQYAPLEEGALSRIAGLTKLTSLAADGTVSTDLEPLTRLTSLRALTLAGNGITDITPLAGLTDLEHLILSDNDISDASALGSLTSIRTLSVNDNQIESALWLEGMRDLTSLNLQHNRIRELGSVADAAGLRHVALGDNAITDLSGLGDTSRLESLGVDDQRVLADDAYVNTPMPAPRVHIPSGEVAVDIEPAPSAAGAIADGVLTWTTTGMGTLTWSTQIPFGAGEADFGGSIQMAVLDPPTFPLDQITSSPEPYISGDPRPGVTLTLQGGDWQPWPVELSYQWFRNGVAIPGATFISWGAGPSDVGARYSVRIIATKDFPDGTKTVTKWTPEVVIVR
ncbi:cell wall-binding repeat-containing protein [Microbacterium aoyamense]|uniref:cell wall-binding repeat-containing protein n=1 Tax=Microbacterium aoyamense TaxID=344166 RepID=UPI0020055DD5|nr:cell wall-binding repeat-containing protein [Microbacterium aoyamense]